MAAEMGFMALNEGASSNFATALVGLAVSMHGSVEAYTMMTRAIRSTNMKPVTDALKYDRARRAQKAQRDAELKRKSKGKG